MVKYRFFKVTAFLVTIVALLFLTVVACLPLSEPNSQPNAPTPTNKVSTPTPMNDLSSPPSTLTPTQNAPITRQGTPAPTDVWLAVLRKEPYPYTTPLPPQTPTALDGIYTKFEPKEGTPVPCRRCPDYLPEGGLWKLNLAKGMFRIFHESSGWYSLGSFTVSADQILLFNDPTCLDTVGIYKWRLTEGKLRLKVIEDTCQVGRRASSFSSLTWSSCEPPSTEAAVTDLWPRPAGCTTSGE